MAVDELDTRLERLRVLMEQYFQGIEKIPPNVVHKDVERRIWILRREKIRNTGTRFRFQQIIQRYNTFSSYWIRIMREIENGTYRRDVLRAKKRFGIDATKPVAPVGPQTVELNADDMDEELPDDLSDFGDLGPLPTGPQPPVVAKPGAPPGPPPPHRPPAPPAPPPVANKPVAAPPPPAKPAPPPVASAPPIARPLPQRAPPSPFVPKILASKVESDDDLDNMLDAALGPGAQPAKRPEPAKPPVAAAPAPQAVARPAPVAARPATPALKPQPTGGEEYRRVYAQYVEARRRNGESTAGLTYETLAKSLEQTKDKLRDKTAGKKIDFEVAVKDGKTILKPVVR